MANDLADEIQSAVKLATTQWHETKQAEWAKRRIADRKSRSKGIKRRSDSGWVEQYPLKIEHQVVHSGRDCVVSIDGCATQFVVQQHFHRPMFNYNGLLRLGDGYKPLWELHVREGDEVTVIEDFSENFESLVQKAIVCMVGHAYMDIQE